MLYYNNKTVDQSFSYFLSSAFSMFQIKTNILVAFYIDNGFAFYDIYAKKSQPYVIKVRGENVRDGLSNTALCHIDKTVLLLVFLIK